MPVMPIEGSQTMAEREDARKVALVSNVRVVRRNRPVVFQPDGLTGVIPGILRVKRGDAPVQVWMRGSRESPKNNSPVTVASSATNWNVAV